MEKFRRSALEIEDRVVVIGLSSLITCPLKTGDKELLFVFMER